jgi:hypothetical protein
MVGGPGGVADADPLHHQRRDPVPITVAQAIDEARARDAHVITMSLGGAPSFSLFNALRRAVQADVIVLAAAGNCVRQVVRRPLRGLHRRRRLEFPRQAVAGSCRGTDVDVSAPAENVFRAKAGGLTLNEVGQGEGTSFAVALGGRRRRLLARASRPGQCGAGGAAQWRNRPGAVPGWSAPRHRRRRWDTTSFGTGVLDMRRLLEVDLGFGAARRRARRWSR